MPSALRRFLLWDYSRGSWQYDLVVGLILVFIFLTPREYFRDQPKASNIVLLPSDPGSSVYWIELELLEGIRDPDRPNRIAAMLKARYGRNQTVVHLEPILDSEREIKGYMAYTRP